MTWSVIEIDKKSSWVFLLMSNNACWSHQHIESNTFPCSIWQRRGKCHQAHATARRFSNFFHLRNDDSLRILFCYARFRRHSSCTGWSWVKIHRWALLLLRHNFAPLCVHRPFSFAFYDFTVGWKRKQIWVKADAVLLVYGLSSVRCNYRQKKETNERGDSRR